MNCVGSTYLTLVENNRLLSRFFPTLQFVSRDNLDTMLFIARFDHDDNVVKLALIYMIFCISLVDSKSVKIDAKYFAFADNLE